MKFKAAVAISVAFHLSVAAIALYVPVKGGRGEVAFYVDLTSAPGGGPGGGAKDEQSPGETIENLRMKDLTTAKEEPQAQLRYPDEKVKQSKKKKVEKEKKKTGLITVVKNDMKQKPKEGTAVTGKGNLPSNILKTGISSGAGAGSGVGYGPGSGGKYGPGSGLGGFPYSYYIETLRSKISSSWYNALVSPGLRGRFVAAVSFKILRNGQIRDLEPEGKSGNDSLDLSALRAIENAAPFPPLPIDYPDAYLVVHFEFEWEKK